ncbi:hypothetical protein SAY86_023636 [Trapa natans]|uniref:Uncharacterized protein n=1 Tax=Trapa natans TaxID=22666 RepID=A0AAN7RAE4_TRANT|nr:hypothetical protein SAY86_023636 [Trapa natans]
MAPWVSVSPLLFPSASFPPSLYIYIYQSPCLRLRIISLTKVRALMARSLSSRKLLSAAVVVDGFSSFIKRRGISAAAAAAAAAATQGVVGTGSAVMPKKAGERKVGSAHKVTWGPDPKTGYYRPDDRTEEIDVAELRAAFLNRESNKRG